ncbi:MAG: phage terminase large subunit family protein [Planctomycetaceae bacterium]|nr:phage terminase large subunit family protein [Planctomycetaceae bacterium]
MSSASNRVYDLVAETIAHAITPEPRLSVWEWADRYRVMTTESTGEPGPWSTDRVPYLREIMEAMSPSCLVQEVVVQKGVQVGASEMLLNLFGFAADLAPGPFIIVQPSIELADGFSAQRLEPMIQNCERLRDKVGERKTKSGKNAKRSKSFPGGILRLFGANSAKSMRQTPSRYLCLDELDAYPLVVKTDGDPVGLLEGRTTRFQNRKIVKVSTPTLAGSSRIERAFLRSDQRHFHVPCPSCGHKFVIEWELFSFERDDEGELIPESVGVGCPSCGALATEANKTRMFAAGEWIAKRPGRRIRGYHLPTFYAPAGTFSWVSCVEQFLEAHRNGDDAAMQVWKNNVCGEVWRESSVAVPEWQQLFARREQYPVGKIPPMLYVRPDDLRGPVVLTAGCDVQRDRLEFEVLAWGPRMESWSIDYRVIQGDPGGQEVWQELDELLLESFAGEGRQLSIQTLAIDSGDGTTSSSVYAWGRRQDPRRVMVCKGGPDSLRMALQQPKAVDVDRKGKRINRGVKIWLVGGGHLKGELYGWLRQQPPTNDQAPSTVGWSHFPEYGEEWFKQLVAESLVPKPVRGYRRYEWRQDRARNEALDCRVLARAAADRIGLPRWTARRWLREYERQPAIVQAPAAPRVKRTRGRRGGGYLDGMRGGL